MEPGEAVLEVLQTFQRLLGELQATLTTQLDEAYAEADITAITHLAQLIGEDNDLAYAMRVYRLKSQHDGAQGVCNAMRRAITEVLATWSGE